MENNIFSVSDINRSVKHFLEEAYQFKNVFVEGELSNITYYKSGHLYFTLKDERASVKCAVFKYAFKGVERNLKEGDKVKVLGSISLYEQTGSYQLICEAIEKQSSLGELYKKLEELKAKYLEKGYFDQENKKKLIKVPQNIGVVTAETGAAIHDIINTTRKRFKNINIYLYPSKVQGEGAAKEIAKGIKLLNKFVADGKLELDFMIVGRGGGSIEDLWAFNEEEVIEAIYESELPIISAVGHEIDNLLSDLVADKRAATPTQAIEMSVPLKEDLLYNLNSRKEKLEKLLILKIDTMKKEIEYKKNNYYMKNFQSLINDHKLGLMQKEKFLNRELSSIVEKLRYRFNNTKLIFDKISIDKKVKIEKEELSKKKLTIDKFMINKIEGLKKEMEYKKVNLSKYSMNDILKQGYTLTKKNGKIVKRGIEVSQGDKLVTQFSDMNVTSVAK